MNSEHSRLEQLFHKALEIPGWKERELYLAVECRGDDPLRRRVNSLIRAHEMAAGFMNPPAADASQSESKTQNLDAAHNYGRIGNLRLLECVADSAFCRVYLAEQLQPVRRPVALKIAKPGSDLSRAQAQLRAEQQAVAVLDHPNIARIYDAGFTPKGLPYLVLEWIRGSVVTRYADDARSTLRNRLELFLQICAGVEHAHSRGVIHSDLKPGNILVAEYDGQAIVKIVDFGISRDLWALPEFGHGTEISGNIEGTPAFMSPEQASEYGGTVDVRTDVFSLGAVLYVLLTGMAPFQCPPTSADPTGLRRLIKDRQFMPPSIRVERCENTLLARLAGLRKLKPSGLVAALRGDLDAILARSLQVQPEKRYDSVAKFAEDIRRFLDDREVSVRRLTWSGRTHKFVRRHRVVLTGISAITFVLFAAGLNALDENMHSRSLKRQAAQQEQEAAQAKQDTAQERSRQMALLGSDAVSHGDASKAISWFARAAHLALPGSEERTSNLRRVRVLAEHVAIPVGACRLSSPAQLLEFCHDPMYLGTLEAGGTLTLWNWQEDKILSWSREIGKLTCMEWDPQHRMLALGRENGSVEIRLVPEGKIIWHAQTGEKLMVLRFSPDGKWLATAGKTLRLWSRTEPDEPLWEWKHPAPVYALNFSPSGSRLASASLDQRARVFALGHENEAAGRLLGVFHHEKGFPAAKEKLCCEHSLIETDVVAPLFVIGENSLLSWTGVGELTAWNIPNCSVTGKLEGTCFSTRLLTSPSGRWNVVTIRRGAAELRADPYALAPPLMRMQHRERICDVAFGPSEKRVLTVSADQTARLWRVPEGTEALSPMIHSREVVHGAFARNGKWIATAQLDGLIRVWRLPESERETQCLSLDSSGPWLVYAAPSADKLVMAPKVRTTDRRFAVMSLEGDHYSVAGFEPLPGEVVDGAWSAKGDNCALLMACEASDDMARSRIEIRQGPNLVSKLQTIELPFVAASLAWHPDGNHISVGEQNGGIWTVHFGEPHRIAAFGSKLEGSRKGKETLVLSNDGRSMIRWWTEGKVEVWDVPDAFLRFELNGTGGGRWLVDPSPTASELMMTDAHGATTLRNLENGEIVGTPMYHPGGLMTQGFSSDGKWVITSGHDRRILVRDRLSGKSVCPPLVHPDEAFDFTLPLDGAWLAAVCRDGTFHVWDTQTGAALLPVWSAGESLSSVQLGASSQRAILTGEGSRIWIRDMPKARALPESTLEEATLLSEVVSGSGIDQIPNEFLPSELWLSRLHKFLELRPDFADR